MSNHQALPNFNQQDNDFDFMDDLINTSSNLSPFGLHASMSPNYYPMARLNINTLFNNRNSSRMICIGYSSGGLRSHCIFRSSNGKIYNVHNSYGEMDIFYFTKDDLQNYFEGHLDEMPKFEEPPEVIQMRTEYYGPTVVG